MKYFYPVVNFNTGGFGLQEIEFIKEHKYFIYGQPHTVFEYGKTHFEEEKNYFNRKYLFENIDDATEFLYKKLDKLLEILKDRTKETKQNIVIAQEILREEKKLAKETEASYKRLTNSIKNVDINKILERKGYR